MLDIGVAAFDDAGDVERRAGLDESLFVITQAASQPRFIDMTVFGQRARLVLLGLGRIAEHMFGVAIHQPACIRICFQIAISS